MAKTNSYGNGPTLFQMAQSDPKWSEDLELRTKDKGLRTKD